MVTIDDAGTVINPLPAEGQRDGGIAQGAAQAFLEEVVYDAEGSYSGRALSLTRGRPSRRAGTSRPAGS